MSTAIILIGGILIAALFMLIGLSKSQPFPECDGCRDPMPNGYEACDTSGPKVKRYCRRCATARGMKPWYWSPRDPE